MKSPLASITNPSVLLTLLSVAFASNGFFAQLGAATSVNQFGITWTWTEDRTVGQFANGDWWVVGPITMTSISPATANDRNGTMINPTRSSQYWFTQGWDSRQEQASYSASLNIARNLPLVINAGSSVCSAISLTNPANHMCLDTMAILTVLSSAPPAGSFRPSYQGTDKTIRWNKSQIDYSKLRNLTPVSGAPTLTASTDGGYNRPYIVFHEVYYANFQSPYNNLPVRGANYGREHEAAASAAALLLNLNYPNSTKETLAVGFIQWGLDIYGAAAQGVRWPGAGGHQGGRKMPMLMAGVLLNDSSIIAMASSDIMRFAEDTDHFYVSQSDINTARWVDPEGRPIEPFTQSMLGRPEWGSNHAESPTHSGSNWGIYYRDVCCPNWVGTALACHLMGIEQQWNGTLPAVANGAFFDYYNQRYFPTERGTGRIPAWIENMWDAYRGSTPPPTTIPTTPGPLVSTPGS